MKLISAVLAAILCALPITGRATLITYNLEDVRVTGIAPGVLAGWLTFDDVARVVPDFRIAGDIDFVGLGPLAFELQPFGPSCNMPSMGCTFATVDAASNIILDRAGTPSSLIHIVLDPDGPLSGNYVALTAGFVEFPSTRLGSYFVGMPNGQSIGAITGALVVPEPSSLVLLISGLAIVGLLGYRRAMNAVQGHP